MKTTNQILSQMKSQALGDAYLKAIRDMYQASIDAGEFEEEVRDYEAAKQALPALVSEEKLSLLAKAESISEEIRKYAAEYSFSAGIFSGFKQFFTPDNEPDGGFAATVASEIETMPNMLQHSKYYSNIEQRNSLFEQLRSGEEEAVQEHIISIECELGQRVHSAAVNGFYYGYRAAVSVIQTVDVSGPFALEQKILSLEHTMGYIKSYEEIERQVERNAEANS